MHLENASVTHSTGPSPVAYRELSFETTRIARETRPGQFVHIRVPEPGRIGSAPSVQHIGRTAR